MSIDVDRNLTMDRERHDKGLVSRRHLWRDRNLLGLRCHRQTEQTEQTTRSDLGKKTAQGSWYQVHHKFPPLESASRRRRFNSLDHWHIAVGVGIDSAGQDSGEQKATPSPIQPLAIMCR
ncbi:MAG: hypothetical protein ACOY42_00015 [Pseudomonadota bacterium]